MHCAFCISCKKRELENSKKMSVTWRIVKNKHEEVGDVVLKHIKAIAIDALNEVYCDKGDKTNAYSAMSKYDAKEKIFDMSITVKEIGGK